MKRIILFFLIGAFSFLLSSCGKPPPPFPIPIGIQTMTGTLLPADISVLRRGTHFLVKDGRRLCFVESTTVNLHAFEQKSVTVRGTFEANIDPTLLPVLVTQEVTPVEEETQNVTFSPSDLTGVVPRSWLKGTQKGVTVFLPEGGGEPVLSVSRQKATPLPTSGAPFQISGHHAVRNRHSGTSGETLSIEDGTDLILMTFTPRGNVDEPTLLRTQWAAFLSSLRFGAASSASSLPSSGSGALKGTPCGGTAGILCPAGQYCAITDLQENIGHCRGFSDKR